MFLYSICKTLFKVIQPGNQILMIIFHMNLISGLRGWGLLNHNAILLNYSKIQCNLVQFSEMQTLSATNVNDSCYECVH